MNYISLLVKIKEENENRLIIQNEKVINNECFVEAYLKPKDINICHNVVLLLQLILARKIDVSKLNIMQIVKLLYHLLIIVLNVRYVVKYLLKEFQV